MADLKSENLIILKGEKRSDRNKNKMVKRKEIKIKFKNFFSFRKIKKKQK